jgi:hypothetical protein
MMHGLWKFPESFEDDLVSLFAANNLDLALRPGWKVKQLILRKIPVGLTDNQAITYKCSAPYMLENCDSGTEPRRQVLR